MVVSPTGKSNKGLGTSHLIPIDSETTEFKITGSQAEIGLGGGNPPMNADIEELESPSGVVSPEMQLVLLFGIGGGTI